MMGFLGFGLTAVIPVAVLLAISFFVLLGLQNVNVQGLKTFGNVVVVLLWLSAALVLAMGIYGLVAGGSHAGMHHGMKGRMAETMEESTGDPMRDAMRKEMQRETQGR